MATRRKKKSALDELLKTNPAREAVFKKLWETPRYVKTNDLKDRLLRAWNQADAYKNTRSGSPEKAARLDRRVKLVLTARNKMEARALKKAGLDY